MNGWKNGRREWKKMKIFIKAFNCRMQRVWMPHRIGYGKWNEIYAKLMRHPYFRLHLLLRAMGPSRLKYRVDQILRACSKKTTKKRNSPESSMNASVSVRSPSKDDEESEPPSN